jgi:hypothetical protein
MAAAMALDREPFTLRREGGWCVGPWRQPVNNSRDEAGTIHDDATAQRLGFAAGPVAGSIHFEQFAPLLRAVFGTDWSRTGSLSLWFDTPAFDGEALQAAVEDNSAPRRRVRLLRNDGALIAHGSASSGMDEAGEVRQRLQRQPPGEPARMLAAVRPGFSRRGLSTRVAAVDVQARRTLLTEPVTHDEVPLSTAIHALRVYEAHMPIALGSGIGLFGAIEWQWLHGPMRAERAYDVAARVLAVGTSPKSEMLWTEATLSDPAAGCEVARMLMLSRLLKQSSPLWNPGETNK